MVERLRIAADQLKAAAPAVRAVHLFGSFAHGTPTPRSDADVLVEVDELDQRGRRDLLALATDSFLRAPVPVEVFVATSLELREGRGVAAAVREKGVRLA